MSHDPAVARILAEIAGIRARALALEIRVLGHVAGAPAPEPPRLPVYLGPQAGRDIPFPPP
jgi:hypothetical protein